jgi:hypothetical protein
VIKRNYSDVKAELARVCGAAGMVVSDARLLTNTNLAIEELINELDHPLFYDRLRFVVHDGKITLPYPYERAVGIKLNEQPIVLQSPWFEFVGYGWDLLTGWSESAQRFDESRLGPGYLTGALDRDDVVFFKDIPAVSLGVQYILRLRTTTDERISSNMPADVIVQGYDGNGDWIRSQNNAGDWIDGVTFVWTADGSFQVANSAQVFSSVVNVTKPVTRQPIDCYMIGTTGSTGEIQIGRWGATETHPQYRRYFVRGLPNDRTYCVDARVRRRYLPIVADGDFLLVSNLPALKEMVMAIYKRDADDFGNYQAHKETCKALLMTETKSYIGLQRQRPVVTMADGTGVRQDGLYIV